MTDKFLRKMKHNKVHASALRRLQVNRAPIALGTETPWGKVAAVGIIGDFIPERYYWFVDFGGGVSMLPACIVESTSGKTND